MNAFESVRVYSELDFTRNFHAMFDENLKPGIRGYGYWAWKPWIIKKELEAGSYGDLLVYADIGFNLNPRGQSRLREYFQRVQDSTSGVLGFQANRPDPGGPVIDDGRSIPAWFDRYWTKGDLIDYFGVRNANHILETPQIQSGLIFIRNCPNAMALIDDWFQVFRTNMNLVDDSESISPNFPGFREHRHDQSALSILGKLRGIDTISSSEFWMPHWWTSIADWKALELTPFHATRDLDFGSNSLRTGANKDANSRFTLDSLSYNVKLLMRRLANLSKPVAKRFI